MKKASSPQGVFGSHAEWGHEPEYPPRAPEGGAERMSCGEFCPAPEEEAQAG